MSRHDDVDFQVVKVFVEVVVNAAFKHFGRFERLHPLNKTERVVGKEIKSMRLARLAVAVAANKEVEREIRVVFQFVQAVEGDALRAVQRVPRPRNAWSARLDHRGHRINRNILAVNKVNACIIGLQGA